ncbi:MAG: class C beta-lactamase-related serine hydrolase [Chloroflexi bacterium]|nr:MAG: class C beta-lactamase-related serine hydrolase [Chloroflexota bacterium]
MKYILDRKMVAAPGTSFTYNSGATMLLGGILEKATGQSVEDYTAVTLFKPLKITKWQWDRTPKKHSNTGWGLHLRPLDMLKFGQLYLQQGNWQGKQIISQEWVTQSTQPSVYMDNYNYAYQWWRFTDNNPIVSDLAQNDIYYAWGYGGNFIFIVPHLDLIVVTTAENFDNSAQFFPALVDHIFPAYN